MKKRVVSLLLCFVLCLSFLPMGVFAEEIPDEPLTAETPPEESSVEEIPAEATPNEENPTEGAPAEEPEEGDPADPEGELPEGGLNGPPEEIGIVWLLDMMACDHYVCDNEGYIRKDNGGFEFVHVSDKTRVYPLVAQPPVAKSLAGGNEYRAEIQNGGYIEFWVNESTGKLNTIVVTLNSWSRLGFNPGFVLNFDANGGRAPTFEDSIRFGREGTWVTAPADPVHDGTGYTFGGWYTQPDGGNPVSFPDLFYEDATIYARWLCDIEYDYNYSESGVPAGVRYSEQVLQGNTPEHVPERTGYRFAGWYKDAACTEKITAVTEPGTLYASWEKQVYTVSFDLQGRGETIPPRFAKYETLITAPEDPVDVAYVFGGWYKDSVCGVPWTFSKDLIMGDTTLYAKWIAPCYVQFYTDHGIVPEPQSIRYGEKVAKPADPVEDMMVFLGWFTEEACENAWDFEMDTVSEDRLDLYAGWAEKTYVGIDPNNGEGAFFLEAAVGEKMPSFYQPQNGDLVLEGWYTDRNFAHSFDLKNDPVTKNLSLIAKWTEGATVSFDTQGHGTAPANIRTQRGCPFTPPEMDSVPGYAFQGWYKDADCKDPWTDADTVLEDMTLYAGWLRGTPVDAPEAVLGLVYDGSVQTGVQGIEGCTLTGNANADAGSYTATASLEPGYIWDDDTVEDKKIEWTIAKAVPTASLFTFTAPQNLIADGTPKYASVIFDTDDGKLTGMGSITARYQKLSESGWSTNTTAAPTEPGTYRVIADVSEGDNYISASELAADSWKFTVTAPVTYSISITVNDGKYGEAVSDKQTAAAGDTVTLTATPGAGFCLKEWQSEDVTVAEDGIFTMPEKDVTVQAIFAEDPWLMLQQAVLNGGTVTLTSDVVCDNQAYGPIVVPDGVTVTIDLNGHTINRNLSDYVDNGQVIDVYGNLTVKDGSSEKTGTITGGKNTGAGNTIVAGGIQLNGGALVLESGSITGCLSERRGAGVNVESGSFLMKGGSISNNTATSHGAGVSLSRGTFTMTGGIISGNYANTGAGVCASLADLFLSGGEISGNTARDNAGGLNTFGTSNVTLNGCRITGNTAPKAAGASFFLQDKSNYSFKVGKNTVIAGNTDTNGNPSNLYVNNFNNSTWITIMDGSYAPNGMNIGISSKEVPTVSAPVPVSDTSADIGDLAYFTSDSDEYDVIYAGTLQLAVKDMCGVTFRSGAHGTDPAPVVVEKGNRITRPEDPSEHGYSFLGWYKDAAFENPWNFNSDTVNDNMLLYGKWEDSAWLALQQAVLNGGTVTLTRDVVCDNQAYGPIVVPDGVTVTIDLNGHTINRNLSDYVDNGQVIDVYGNLTVKDGSSEKTGTITGGKNTGADNKMVAGGIQLNGGALVLESGSITGCLSERRGAGVNVESGSFLMKGGSISNNTATSHGAGVSLSRGTFTMTGGIISGNYANTGAGVCTSLADLFLSGGEISGNTARDNAGGLNTFGTSNVTLNGCRITGNTAPKAAGASFFLQDKSNYSFKVGKDTVIAGNTDSSGNPSNLYLNNISSITWITVMGGENAPDGMNIGISSKEVPTVSAPVPVSDSTMKDAYRGCFFSDNEDYWTDVKDSVLYLTAEAPTCSVTYTGSDKVTFSGASGDLTASAKAGDTVSFTVTPDAGCTLGTCSVKTAGGVPVTVFVSGSVYSFTMPADDTIVTVGLSIDVPAAVTGLIYDGNTKTGVEEGEGYTLTGNTAVDAGHYTAVAALKDGYIWNDDSLENKEIEWTIAKAAPTFSAFRFSAPENLVADGQPKNAAVIFDTKDGKLTGMGSITVRYQKLSEEGWGTSTTDAPTEPGTYKVLADVSEGDNFTSVSELAADSWKFTVTAPTYTVTVTDDGHGTAGADPASGTANTPVKLSATPAEGYEFDQWEVIRGGVTVTNDQFTIGTSDVEIKACFKAIIPPAPILTGISISKAPDKTTYIAGESFDRTGMVVTATYSDDSTRIITDYTVSPAGALAAADTAVTVSYTDGNETKTATQTIAVNPAPVIYTIIEGANSTWTKGSTVGLLIRSDAPFAKFDSVKVDGTTIAAANYISEEGSTKITFSPAYLEMLIIGPHSIEIVSNDGSASTIFTVRSAVPPVPKTYTVTFHMNGHGAQIAAQTVEEGEKAARPANPTASGYTFGGWYADATCSTKFDFNSAITADTTVYAKWTKNSVPPFTGDNSNIMLWTLLLAASGVALAGTAICSRKRKKY